MGHRYFKTPGQPLSRHNLFMQREAWCLTCCNIGFLYCQNCAAGGPAQHVFRGTVQRLEAALKLERDIDLFKPLLDGGIIQRSDIRCDFVFAQLHS
jgi:hypothetical protein